MYYTRYTMAIVLVLISSLWSSLPVRRISCVTIVASKDGNVKN